MKIRVAILLAACACSTETTETKTESKTEDGEVFWDAFNNGRYEDIEKVQASLRNVERDGYLERLMGISYFWKGAEGQRNPSAKGEASLAILTAVDHLEKARELAPSDPKLPRFLGMLNYMVGDALNDQARKEAGTRELDRGIGMYPQLTTYCRAVTRALQPKDSPEFQLALEDFWSLIKMCSPDITPENPYATDPKPMERCTQRARVPHGYNGFWLTVGDTFAKAGQLDLAKAFYANAKLAHFDDWSFRSELETRLAQPDSARPLSYETAHACVMCHSK